MAGRGGAPAGTARLSSPEISLTCIAIYYNGCYVSSVDSIRIGKGEMRCNTGLFHLPRTMVAVEFFLHCIDFHLVVLKAFLDLSFRIDTRFFVCMPHQFYSSNFWSTCSVTRFGLYNNILQWALLIFWGCQIFFLFACIESYWNSYDNQEIRRITMHEGRSNLNVNRIIKSVTHPIQYNFTSHSMCEV